MTELTIRRLAPGETGLFLSYPFVRTPGLWETARDYEALLASGEYRPEHTWIALRDGIVVARACFWAGREDTHPMSLDWLEAEPGPQQVELATTLLHTAHQTMRNAEGKRPDYHLFMPPGWRDDPTLLAAGEARLSAAENAGLVPFVERFTYRWSAERDGLPSRTERLTFRSADDDEVLAVLQRLLAGTLDAHDQHAVATLGIAQAAKQQLEDLQWFPSPRDWWQLAYARSGELVGLIVPARNYSQPTIGYIGVVPEQRGHGYVDDLLAEMAWRLSESAPGETVGADTDFGNVPMANAFARAGFRVVEEHLVLTDAG
jgi:RimJ/RimL family protein N-acetyltransferase